MRPARLLIPIAVPFSFVLGHLAGFAVAHDDSSAKQPVEAGHEYLASLGRLAIPLLVASMFLALWSGMRGARLLLAMGRRPPSSSGSSSRSSWSSTWRSGGV